MGSRVLHCKSVIEQIHHNKASYLCNKISERAIRTTIEQRVEGVQMFIALSHRVIIHRQLLFPFLSRGDFHKLRLQMFLLNSEAKCIIENLSVNVIRCYQLREKLGK